MNEQIKAYWSSPDSPKVRPFFECQDRAYEPPADSRADMALLTHWWGPMMRGKRVLDIGAGPGKFVDVWADYDVDLTCIEWSECYYTTLKKRCDSRGARAFQLDITSEHLSEEFDLVFCTQVLLHIPPEDIATAIENMKSMMGGHAAVMTWQGKTFDSETGSKLQSFSHDYQTLFARAGLNIIFDSLCVADIGDPRRKHNRLYYLSVDRTTM